MTKYRVNYMLWIQKYLLHYFLVTISTRSSLRYDINMSCVIFLRATDALLLRSKESIKSNVKDIKDGAMHNYVTKVLYVVAKMEESINPIFFDYSSWQISKQVKYVYTAKNMRKIKKDENVSRMKQFPFEIISKMFTKRWIHISFSL